MERATGIEPALQAWETCEAVGADLVRKAPAQVSGISVLAVADRRVLMPTGATGTRMARRGPLIRSLIWIFRLRPSTSAPSTVVRQRLSLSAGSAVSLAVITRWQADPHRRRAPRAEERKRCGSTPKTTTETACSRR